MGMRCDLQVDVNGEEIFFVNKEALVCFSGRLSKLFSKFTGAQSSLKVIFHDFPGGAEGFELVARFCYNNGRIEMTPSNIFTLHFAANFMEMNADSSGIPNLVSQTEKYLQGLRYWTWSELLVGLKQCQNLYKIMGSSRVLHEFLKLLVGRLAFPGVSSPSTSSSDISSPQLSIDTVIDNMKTHSPPWWFEDLVFLNINWFEMAIKTMISLDLDHGLICSFIFRYQKSSFFYSVPPEKCKIIETVINMLPMLDGSSICCRGLFHILRVTLSLQISKRCKEKLESMIGSRLDQATLDDLLIPPPHRKNYMYDVNLILRLQKKFLLYSGNGSSTYRLKKVAGLMDLYMAEVAPDPSLKPSKFVALAMALPHLARDSHDGIYRALDMYLEVHGGLSEEEKMELCCALNCDKLSIETLKHLASDSKFPYAAAITALVSHQCKLKSLVQDAFHVGTLTDRPFCYQENGSADAQHGLFSAEKFNFSTQNKKRLRTQMQHAQCRMVDLVKVRSKIEPQMSRIMKSRLPKLCPSVNVAPDF